MTLGGFFPELVGSKKNTSQPPPYPSPRCDACKLHKTCKTPYMKVDGKGEKGILIIAEAPGSVEDDQGIPLCGKTGQHLERTLAEFDIDMRKDCWLTNTIRCRPPGNVTPTEKQIAWCRPYLFSTSDRYGDVLKLKPKVIILLGSAAVKSVIGWLWKEDSGGVGRWAGWQIPDQKLNAWICAAWHPSYVVREEKNRAVSLLWRRHLQAACSLRKRPWKEIPNYEGRVIVETIPRQAVQYIRTIIDMNKPTAFDYETTMLKPDGDDAEIVTCALSNGTLTISYPWANETRKATQEFIQSPLPKIASNIKFENRWTHKEFGHGIKNEWFDTMLASHFLDNRPDITSIKWQAYALLGQPSWDDEVKPYFQSSGPNKPNRIKQLMKHHLRKLLLYNGLDSLLEYEVAMIQAKKIGWSWE